MHIIRIPPDVSHRLAALKGSYTLPLGAYYTQESKTLLQQKQGGGSESVTSIVENLGGKAYTRRIVTAERRVMSLSSHIILVEERTFVYTTQRSQTSNYDSEGVLVGRLTRLAMCEVSSFVLSTNEPLLLQGRNEVHETNSKSNLQVS